MGWVVAMTPVYNLTHYTDDPEVTDARLWVPFDGDFEYEKTTYLVRAPDGRTARAWPNAGHMHLLSRLDGYGATVPPGKGVIVMFAERLWASEE